MTPILTDSLRALITDMFCRTPPEKPLTALRIARAIADYFNADADEDLIASVKQVLSQMPAARPMYRGGRLAYTFEPAAPPTKPRKRYGLKKGG